MKSQFSIILFASLILWSCKNEAPIPVPPAPPELYFHLSRTRTNQNPDIDQQSQRLNLDQFDMTLLGGDMAYLSSKDDETMAYLDSIFDLDAPETLWALGNHDYSNLTRISQFTDRPIFYSSHHQGITFVVLDTQDSLSNIIGAQREMLDMVLDTIDRSSHLVLLHHKLIWMHQHPVMDAMLDSVTNGHRGNCFFCLNPNNFQTDLYPQLQAVQARGIQVICLGGDIGSRVKSFQYIDNDGIVFLASGVDFADSDNVGIVFTHQIAERRLDWEFVPLDQLTE
ncbi:MAG: hypothetical protein AAF206_25990 [Bacteroidota bacterium]